MNYVLFFLVAIFGAILIVWQNWSLDGFLAAGSALVLVSGLPLLLDRLRRTYSFSGLAPSMAGILLALAAVGLASPLFQPFSTTVIWLVALTVASVTGYAFKIHFEGKPSAPVPLQHTEVRQAPIASEVGGNEKPKILDTSVIIDGRIIDIAGTGFVEGPFVVPNFVLREIQLISDSPDAIKRNRGRRGLDMLNQLQKRTDLEVRISYTDYTDTREVDAKLIKLAVEQKGVLVTNDFNLNKVAELQGVKVLNINSLANALKPVVLPGEELEIQVVKEGKDENQGIGYLDDGTMVVIESGGKLMGKKVKVNVTSVFQTNAGKMIFTKIVGR